MTKHKLERQIKRISFILIYSILCFHVIAENSFPMDMDDFYQDYIVQRAMLANIKEMNGRKPFIRNVVSPSEHKDYTAIQTKYENLIKEAAKKHQLPKELIMAVIRVESAFMENAISCKGAQGLMQLMPETARELGVRDPFNPRENILGGSRLLKSHLIEYGSVKRALIAYNAGPRYLKNNRSIPEETKQYISRVIRHYYQYINER